MLLISCPAAIVIAPSLPNASIVAPPRFTSLPADTIITPVSPVTAIPAVLCKTSWFAKCSIELLKMILFFACNSTASRPTT